MDAFHNGVSRDHDIVAYRLQDRRIVNEVEGAGIARKRLEVTRDQRILAGDFVLAICHVSAPSPPGLACRSSMPRSECQNWIALISATTMRELVGTEVPRDLVENGIHHAGLLVFDKRIRHIDVFRYDHAA